MASPVRHVALLLAILLFTPSAGAQSYWAVDAGAVLTRDDGSVTTVAPTAGGVYHTATTGFCTEWRHYAIGADGDVGLAEVMVMCQGWIDPDGYTLDPPLTLVDLPLGAGKTWSQIVDLHPMYGTDVQSAWIQGTVLGPTQATVPAGTFDVVAVQLEMGSTNPLLPIRTVTVLLQANLGDVTGLVSWQGVVSAEPSSWGGGSGARV